MPTPSAPSNLLAVITNAFTAKITNILDGDDDDMLDQIIGAIEAFGEVYNAARGTRLTGNAPDVGAAIGPAGETREAVHPATEQDSRRAVGSQKASTSPAS